MPMSHSTVYFFILILSSFCFRKAKWSQTSLEGAVTCVLDGSMGIRVASRHFGIPKSTLKDHIDGRHKLAMGIATHIGRPSMLPKEVEDELVMHILKCESMFLGLTRENVMQMAYQIAQKKGLSTLFNSEKQSAGKKWFKLFMKRHPEISLRQPESTSVARARGFNAENVSNFFDVLEQEIDKHQLDGTRIYNVDETGISSIQKKSKKVLGLKGKHQVGSIASGERGQNTTIVCCMSAAGHYVPPLLLFKRVRQCRELSIGAPTGSVVTNNSSAWMDKDMFLKWLQHFANHVQASRSRPVLLILDGHSSHTRSLEAIEFAIDNGIIMVTLPPHTSHKLQPLDVAFFKPLQTYYVQEQEKWLRTNPEMRITQFQIAGLFNQAYLRAAVAGTASKGFERAGIWPCNRHVFDDADFAASIENEGFDVYSCEPLITQKPKNSPFKPERLRNQDHSALKKKIMLSQMIP